MAKTFASFVRQRILSKLFLGTERQAIRLACQNSPVKIRQTLTILRDIERTVLLERICRLVLLWDYQAFKSFVIQLGNPNFC